MSEDRINGKQFPINSLVEIDRSNINLDDFEGDCIYSELRRSDRFFYLGDVHGRDGVGLMASVKTGAVVDAQKALFNLV